MLQLAKLILVVMATCSTGCAVHYFDPDTSTEHIWGFGHMKMKIGIPNEGVQGVVRGTEVLGFSIGATKGESYMTLGWSNLQRLDIIKENTAIRLEWPSHSFECIRIGSEFPSRYIACSVPATSGASTNK